MSSSVEVIAESLDDQQPCLSSQKQYIIVFDAACA